MYVKQIAVLRSGEVAKAANMAEGIPVCSIVSVFPKQERVAGLKRKCSLVYLQVS